MYYVYVLKCINKDLYIGYSNDLYTRIQSHLQGQVKSTHDKRPLTLVYYEGYKDKKDATKRERQLKNHKAKEDLKLQVKNSLSE